MRLVFYRCYFILVTQVTVKPHKLSYRSMQVKEEIGYKFVSEILFVNGQPLINNFLSTECIPFLRCRFHRFFRLWTSDLTAKFSRLKRRHENEMWENQINNSNLLFSFTSSACHCPTDTSSNICIMPISPAAHQKYTVVHYGEAPEQWNSLARNFTSK